MAKYCSNCGQQISDSAAFCKYCGSSQEVDARYTSEMDAVIPVSDDEIREIIAERKMAQKKVGNNKLFLFLGLAAALIVAVSVAGYVMYHSKSEESVPKADTKPAETTEEQSGAQTETKEEEQDKKEQVGTKKGTNNPKFSEGKVYYVQTNLRVREGPGKEYRILQRSELSPDDYAQSVDSTTTTDALMEKGAAITCLEMQGNWMRIESGWVCVEDEGEVLVK